jgi:hypothetical protein
VFLGNAHSKICERRGDRHEWADSVRPDLINKFMASDQRQKALGESGTEPQTALKAGNIFFRRRKRSFLPPVSVADIFFILQSTSISAVGIQ